MADDQLPVQSCRRTDVYAVLQTIHDDYFTSGDWLAHLVAIVAVPGAWHIRLEEAARAERIAAHEPEEN